jgi:hypothetical protein
MSGHRCHRAGVVLTTLGDGSSAGAQVGAVAETLRLLGVR